MKNRFSYLLMLLFVASYAIAQHAGYEQKTSADGRFTYLTVAGDPLGV
jgi:hypothetical protein